MIDNKAVIVLQRKSIKNNRAKEQKGIMFV